MKEKYMKFENQGQIIEELKRLNNLPIEQIESELSKLRMYHEDWQDFTNTTVNMTYVAVPNPRDSEMLQNKEYMSYEDYIRLSEYRQIRVPGRADYMKRQFEQGEKISKEEVEQAQQIKELWEELELKKSPIKEISEYTDCIENTVYDMEYFIGEKSETEMEEWLKNNIDILNEQMAIIQKCFGYVKEKYGDSEKVNEVQNNLIKSLNNGIGILVGRKNGEPKFSDEALDAQSNEIKDKLKEYKSVCEELVKAKIKEQQKTIESQKEEINTQKNKDDKGVEIDE